LPSLGGVKVLVVEDSEATRYVLSRQLARTGAIVQTVNDTEGALPTSTPIDVLIVDLKLPGLDGLELMAWTPTRPPVTITVTAFDTTRCVSASSELGKLGKSFQALPSGNSDGNVTRLIRAPMLLTPSYGGRM
jgi:CheY-like chemotaxis protein